MTNKEYQKYWYLKNKDRILKKRRSIPWKGILHNIKNRCLYSKSSNYKWYGAKGIKCLITEKEIKFLWFRDKAYLMKRPSIDRKDSNKNYTFKNCRFIELKQNCGKEQRKNIFQFTLSNIFIKKWESVSEASRTLKIILSSICECAANKRFSAGGFIWRYK